jgi:hypothetical protein
MTLEGLEVIFFEVSGLGDGPSTTNFFTLPSLS